MGTRKTMEVCAQRLRECRLAAGESLSQTAAFLGITKASLSRWENGKNQKLPLSIIEKLAPHWGVSPTWLVGMDDHKQPLTTIDKANSDNAIIEVSINLLRQLPEKEQKIILAVIRSIADKYSSIR